MIIAMRGIFYMFLSFFDVFWLCRYIARVDEKKEPYNICKHEAVIRRLQQNRHGMGLDDSAQHATNLSDYQPPDMVRYVLGHSFDLSVPRYGVRREEVFAEFEQLFAQLNNHSSSSKDDYLALKAKLTNLAHAYCGTEVDTKYFHFQVEHYRALKSLRTIEFGFNKIMYKQVDGVAMGPPLDHVLANIFVGYYEQKTMRSQTDNKPLCYFRYSDDTCAIF